MCQSKTLLSVLITTVVVILHGCSFDVKTKDPKSLAFNFTDTLNIENIIGTRPEDTGTIRFAVSAITSPKETFTYYHEMLSHIEQELGIKVVMVQRKTYEEVNNLLKLGQADLAIVCSGGYVYGVADSAYRLMVVPERNGKKLYQAYIIVHKDSDIFRFEDLEGKKFAFTDPLSTSGKIYPTKRLKEFKTDPNNFFSSYIYSYAHDNSIQLVAKKLVDGAAINSLVFDYLDSISPYRTKNVRIIEKSEYFAMPPVVISNFVPNDLKKKLENIFLNLHKDPESKIILEKLMVDRYVMENDSIFKSVREIAQIGEI